MLGVFEDSTDVEGLAGDASGLGGDLGLHLGWFRLGLVSRGLRVSVAPKGKGAKCHWSVMGEVREEFCRNW